MTPNPTHTRLILTEISIRFNGSSVLFFHYRFIQADDGFRIINGKHSSGGGDSILIVLIMKLFVYYLRVCANISVWITVHSRHICLIISVWILRATPLMAFILICMFDRLFR